MSLRDILVWPDARLSRTCQPVQEITPDVRRLAGDLLDTMYDAQGRGLAAPQVGELSRLFVMDTAWKEGDPTPRIFINPEIVKREGDKQTTSEGCLSLPGIRADVSRHARVVMQWTDICGTRREETLQGFDAICVQHEIDHLDGIMTFDRLAGDARARVLQAYAGALA